MLRNSMNKVYPLSLLRHDFVGAIASNLTGVSYFSTNFTKIVICILAWYFLIVIHDLIEY